jgi:hypothetical protein
VLRYRSITKEREERKDGGVAARLSVPQPRVQCIFCNGRDNESEKRKARCCGQWHLRVRGGHESGPDGLYRHSEFHFQVRYDFSDHCNNRIKTILVFKINVTRRLYASFLQKTGPNMGVLQDFCGKIPGARLKIRENARTIINIVVGGVGGAGGAAKNYAVDSAGLILSRTFNASPSSGSIFSASAMMVFTGRLPLFFPDHPRKNDLHIRVPAAFPGPGWTEIRGRNRGCPKAINGHLARGKTAVFWQTGHYFGVFSTGTETEGCAGVSKEGWETKPGNGARYGVIFDHQNDPDTVRWSTAQSLS